MHQFGPKVKNIMRHIDRLVKKRSRRRASHIPTLDLSVRIWWHNLRLVVADMRNQ